MITTTNPRTGDITEAGIEETATAQLDAIADAAYHASADLERLGREGRARLLERIADRLEADRADLVHIADQETGLGETRLNGEFTRSVFQFKLFADALHEGSYVEAMIDHAGETPLGPAPDIRRMLLPIGPVAVFGASNFPFAFSVAGGDTASALAAGCPVLLKAHDSHPLTSLRSFEAISSAMRDSNAPEYGVGLIFGQEAGSRLVAHPAIKAVSFTGSLATGKVLLDIVNERPEPIPFYGEMSSLNPFVVTPAAAETRGPEIAEGLFASFTGSGGQLCTKPGIALIPHGAAGDRLVADMADLTRNAAGHVLLNQRISHSFTVLSERLITHGAALSARGQAGDAGLLTAPVLLATSATNFSIDLAEECFGPLIVAVRYGDQAELKETLRRIPNSLTASIHAEPREQGLVSDLTRALAPHVGRIVYNGYPTGVRVCWAQHHGGPWPSTNSQHTSVGVTAIRRFLRPFVWQNAPAGVLPEELRDDYREIPRRVDGALVLAGVTR